MSARTASLPRKPSLRFGAFTRRIIAPWWSRLTPAGRILTASALTAGSLGALTIEIPAYHLFCWLAAAWGLSLAAAAVLRPGVRLTGTFPEKATAGEELSLHFTVTNQRRWPCFTLGADIPGAPSALEVSPGPPVAVLGPGEKTSLTLRLLPRRRGIYGPLKVGVFSTFPFDFFRFCRTSSSPSSLLVYPRFTPLREIEISVGRRLLAGGIALTSNTGESPEYICNREYRHGDSIRRIDFRAWARLSKPAVREYQEEYYCRVALILDTFVPKGIRIPPEGLPDMEAAVSLCAAVADVLARGEFIIDLFAAGPELYVFRAGRHTAHFENVLEILSCLDPCSENPFETVTPALEGELGNISTLLCVFLDWDESRAALVRAARECGCSVKVILVRDGEPTSSPEGAGFEIAHYRPEQVRGGGIEVL